LNGLGIAQSLKRVDIYSGDSCSLDDYSTLANVTGGLVIGERNEEAFSVALTILADVALHKVVLIRITRRSITTKTSTIKVVLSLKAFATVFRWTVSFNVRDCHLLSRLDIADCHDVEDGVILNDTYVGSA
jgi:hypothetical protein